jgi:hypothetical protein
MGFTEKGQKQMRRRLALSSVVIGTALSLVGGAGTASAAPQPGGCPAFGAFMGVSAPWSGQNQRPLGQLVRDLTPFNGALAVFETSLCG